MYFVDLKKTPRTCTRAVGNEVDASRNYVWRVLNGEGKYPYHIQNVHELEPQDYPRRVDCSRWFLHKLADNPEFLKACYSQIKQVTIKVVFLTPATAVFGL